MKHAAYYMEIAMLAASRSTCTRAQVGAVLVKEDRLLAAGFNGAPRGLIHCIDDGCAIVDEHCIRCLHAETNALFYAGREALGATLYVTHAPCIHCCGIVINAGIAVIYYKKMYNDTRIQKIGYSSTERYLQMAGVQLIHIED
jgi:dCMP deaminase